MMQKNRSGDSNVADHYIRPAVPTDADLIAQVEWSAAQIFTSIPQLEWLSHIHCSPRDWRDYLRSNDTCLVAVTAEMHVVGFLCARQIDRHLHIDEVSVRKEWQTCGIGRQLVLLCLHRARDAGFVGTTLTTYRDVPWNAPWYRRLGFDVLRDDKTPGFLRDQLEAERAKGLSPPARVAMRSPGVMHHDAET